MAKNPNASMADLYAQAGQMQAGQKAAQNAGDAQQGLQAKKIKQMQRIKPPMKPFK